MRVKRQGVTAAFATLSGTLSGTAACLAAERRIHAACYPAGRAFIRVRRNTGSHLCLQSAVAPLNVAKTERPAAAMNRRNVAP
jgi:hypothetical protein